MFQRVGLILNKQRARPRWAAHMNQEITNMCVTGDFLTPAACELVVFVCDRFPTTPYRDCSTERECLILSDWLP